MAEKHDTLGATLETAQKLCASKIASVADLERVVASLPGAIAGAERERDALTGRRRETLLSGSDADLLKLDGDIGAADRRLDRLRTVAEELDARLVQAREAATDAARARRRGELLGKRDRMAERLRVEYPKAARAIAGLIEESARLEIEFENFNKVAPADEEIQSPERIARHPVAAQRQEIRRVIVPLWCREGETSPLPAEYQGAVQDQGGGRGALLNRTAQSTPCLLRKFERIEYYSAELVPFFEPLAQGVNLPGLVAGDPDIWRAARNQSHPQSWVNEAERLRHAASARSAPVANRPVETELWLIDDTAQRRVKVA